MLAQCLDFRTDPSPPPDLCFVDRDGGLESLGLDLAAGGPPLMIDDASGGVAAITADGRLAVVSEGEPIDIGAADSALAYGFDAGGRLLALAPDGRLSSLEGVTIASFDVEGTVDTDSGFDIAKGRLVFTVALDGGGFAVQIGGLHDGGVETVYRSDQYVGQGRWSPSGERLAFVGPDYRRIMVTDATLVSVTAVLLDDPRLSRRVNAPDWIDDETVVFFDALPALVLADADTHEIDRIFTYDASAQLFPALPVPISRR